MDTTTFRFSEQSVKYDTRKSIEARIGTLADFLALAKERREAYYGKPGEDRNARRPALSEWIIYGRLYFDSCGNLGFLDESDFLAPRIRHIDPVLSKADFYTEERRFASFAMCGRHPEVDSLCLECGMGWEIESFHDFMTVRLPDDKVGFCHRTCHKMRLLKAELEFFQKEFKEAGFNPGNLVFKPIPNDYGSESYNGPWFIVDTEIGTLKVGWRKRVCVIDWSRTGKSFLHLFEAENVTKDQHMIHAWPGKTAPYLKAIREAT